METLAKIVAGAVCGLVSCGLIIALCIFIVKGLLWLAVR